MNPVLEAALGYVRQGIPVFPCRPANKAPLTPRGFKDATIDEAKITEWWARWPDAMIGMPTGSASGVDVLDIDKRSEKDGFVSLPDWHRRSSIIVKTPSDGAHLYFKSTGLVRNSASKLAPGLDVRGEGGYVVVPPSRNGVGEYRFECGDLTAHSVLPPWPDDLPTGAPKMRRPINKAPTTDTPVRPIEGCSLAAMEELGEACDEMRTTSEGSRNDTLNRLAFATGQLIGSGRLDGEVARAWLGEAACLTGLPKAEIARSIESGIEAGKLKPRFPTIKIVKGEIARNVDYAEAELVASKVPIFERAGILVWPKECELPSADGRKTTAVLLHPIRRENLIYELNKSAAIFKQFSTGKKEFVTVNPPPDVAANLLVKGQWLFPRVSGVTTTPTLRPDGTILTAGGYDAMTQLWYVPDRYLKLPPIKTEPTRADAEVALTLLKSLLTEFPFVGEVDRAVALASLMTPILRGAFDVAPMFLFLAHVAGTGKSHLVNLASTLVTGRSCPVITNCKSADEMEKRLGALILEGATVISLDNCSDDLGGDLLCQITEQPIVRVRILGKSEAPECEWRGTMFGTGNNIRFLGDMTRRGLVCNLDAALERPERRPFSFDPIERVRVERGLYIAAVLTIARAWRVAGEPDGNVPIGSYDSWSRAVRAPLIWLGETDPVKSMDAARDKDPVREAARTLIALWRRDLELGVGYTTAELIKFAEERRPATTMSSGWPDLEYIKPELHDLLMAQAGNYRGQIEPRRVGRWLTNIEGQVHDGHRLNLARASVGHGNRYLLAKVGG